MSVTKLKSTGEQVANIQQLVRKMEKSPYHNPKQKTHWANSSDSITYT